MKKSIYLDVCTLCRPYDDQTQLRIRMETNAVLLIMDSVRHGAFDMIKSPVHDIEVHETTDEVERAEIENFLRSYGKECRAERATLVKRTAEFVRQGIGLADAAHLAFAEAEADCLVTCDDRFRNQSRAASAGCEVLTPVEFCEKEGLR